MNTLNTLLDEIKAEKDTKIIPGNIRSGVEIFNITGTYEGSGGSGLKVYSTVTEMNDDFTISQGDYGLVYNKETNKVGKQGIKIYGDVYFPAQVVLSSAVTTAYQMTIRKKQASVLNYATVNNNNVDYKITLNATTFTITTPGSKSETVHVKYTSSNGITYNIQNNQPQTISFLDGCVLESGAGVAETGWTDYIGSFMKMDNHVFKGIYKAIEGYKLDYITFPLLSTGVYEDASATDTTKVWKTTQEGAPVFNLTKLKAVNTQIQNNIGPGYDKIRYFVANSKLYAIFYSINSSYDSFYTGIDYTTKEGKAELNTNEKTSAPQTLYLYEIDLDNENYTAVTLQSIGGTLVNINYNTTYRWRVEIPGIETVLVSLTSNLSATLTEAIGYSNDTSGTAISPHIWCYPYGLMYYGIVYDLVPNDLNTPINSVLTGNSFYNYNGVVNGIMAGASNASFADLKKYVHIYNAFKEITTIGGAGTSNLRALTKMFYNDTTIYKLPKINLAQYASADITLMDDFCNGCTNLTEVPEMTLSTITNLNNAFNNCPNLTPESLNNIMAICVSSNQTSNKTLKYVGLSAAQATTCTTLSNYTTFTAAGWTTGY